MAVFLILLEKSRKSIENNWYSQYMVRQDNNTNCDKIIIRCFAKKI